MKEANYVSGACSECAEYIHLLLSMLKWMLLRCTRYMSFSALVVIIYYL